MNGRGFGVLAPPKIFFQMLMVFSVCVWANEKNHWCRASDVQHETKTESRRPVHVPGLAGQTHLDFVIYLGLGIFWFVCLVPREGLAGSASRVRRMI